VSSIGLGTYLGESTDEDDAAYEAAVRLGLSAGINLIDTAINYRCQRSERAIGAAIQQVLASGTARRQELVVCSKGGYLPLDRVPPATREEYQAYVKREFIDQEILRPEEIVGGGHSLAPRFIRWCLAKSRQNLGLRTIDIYYLHNPAQQAGIVAPEDLRGRLQAAFAVLEEAATRGEIGVYGCATWGALRQPPSAKDHLSLEQLVESARAVAGDSHHFRVVQLPINLAMPEAVRKPTQPLRGKLVPVVEAAEELGLTVVASASLMQGRLTVGLPDTLRGHFPRCWTDAQRAIAFVRGVSSVTSALVGMKRSEHVTENIAAAAS
jgi:aryl-alcohol dehydrogenase-like predicted oxidoreductase